MSDSPQNPYRDNLDELFQEAKSEEPEDSQSCPLFDDLQQTEPLYSEKTLIAEGGMKQIYRVFDNRSQRFVAMAQLLPDAPGNSTILSFGRLVSRRLSSTRISSVCMRSAVIPLSDPTSQWS